ncbi:complement C1q subcomponent subunit B-like [Saccostrea cucullata]|uniref:complement C1q subcomponent subunit B-like n=1 Tax=Saccostrea cuccullata TaxID=36930 RepID=UPI002ED5E451
MMTGFKTHKSDMHFSFFFVISTLSLCVQSYQGLRIKSLEERILHLEKMIQQNCACEKERKITHGKVLMGETLIKANLNKRVKRTTGLQQIKRNSYMCAFSSILSKDLPNTGRTQTIVFDHVITNTGNAYNRHTGIFHAPSNGIFAFSWTMNSEKINGHFELMHNSKIITAISTELTNLEIGTTSATMVLQLKRNDVVFIRTDHIYGKTNIVSNVLMRSSFSGWQIF